MATGTIIIETTFMGEIATIIGRRAMIITGIRAVLFAMATAITSCDATGKRRR